MPSVPLIKGYLPLRVSLPSRHGDTFLFVKQHKTGGGSQQGQGGMNDGSRTLFVTNVPFVPNVHSRLFLRALFGRFGDVDRVTVARNPRKQAASSLAMVLVEGGGDTDSNNNAIQAWKDLIRRSSLFSEYDGNEEGKFAHVSFTTSREMKRAIKSIQTYGAKTGQKKQKKRRIFVDDSDSDNNGDLSVLIVGNLEIQELMAQSSRLRKTGSSGALKGDNEEENDDNSTEDQEKTLTGVAALATKYRSSVIPRDVLMQHCNAVMETFEGQEEADRQARAASAEPDDDGFVTVTYGPAVGSKRELEEDSGLSGEGRRKASKRSRKKKESRGASELHDFYRFQRRETRKKGLQELRKRFEDDLAAVKKMKEEKKYRPF